MGRTRNVDSSRSVTEARKAPVTMRSFPKMPDVNSVLPNEAFLVDGVDEEFIRKGNKIYRTTLTEV